MIKLKKIIHKFLSIFNLKITKINYGSKDFPIVEASKDEIELLKISGLKSMTSLQRRWALINAIKYVRNNNIQGDFVECGVWKGGNLIIYKNLNEKYQLGKKIYGYDTFKGMSDDVKENLKMYSQNKNLDDVKLIMGKVEETLSINSNLPNEISILRLDTDWYESTKIELDILYPKLVNGGVLIIDDYGHWKGARKAVDEYFFGKKVIKNFIDYSCRMIIK